MSKQAKIKTHKSSDTTKAGRNKVRTAPPAQVRQYGYDDGGGWVRCATRQEAANVVAMLNRKAGENYNSYAVIAR